MKDWINRLLLDPDTDNAGGESAGGDNTGTDAGGATDGAEGGEGAEDGAEAEGGQQPGAEAGPSVIERMQRADLLISQLAGRAQQGQPGQGQQVQPQAAAPKGVLTDEDLAAIADESPGAQKLIQRIDQHYAKALADTQAELAAIKATHGQHSAVIEAQYEQARTSAIQEIAKASGMGDLLGTPGKPLTPDMKAMHGKIVQLASALFTQAHGGPNALSEREAIEHATFAIAGRKGTQAAIQSQVVRRAQQQSVAPGTSRAKTTHTDPKKAAAQAAGEGMRELRRTQNRQ